MDVTAQRDCLHKEADWFLSDRRVLSVGLEMNLRRFSSMTTEIGNISVPLTEQKRLKEEAVGKATDVKYELRGAEVRITLFEGSVIHVQDVLDRIIKPVGRLKVALKRS